MNGGNQYSELEHDNRGTLISVGNSVAALAVSPGSSGEGLPYAPINWPCPGDVWNWKVGKRKNPSGFYSDRYLFLPDRLRKTPNGKLGAFPSKISVREYLKKTFPDADVNEFFASFKWRVPSTDMTSRDLVKVCRKSSRIHEIKTAAVKEPASKSFHGPQTDNCKAGNKICSLQAEARKFSQKYMACHLCCSDTTFCRDCCCILCSRTIDWEFGSYSFVKCEAKLDEEYICGHVAHVKCALRSYMAGAVGGIIDLDAEYFCRRCDNKMDLIPHVTKLLHSCELLGSSAASVNILDLGVSILRGAQNSRARNLLCHFEMVLTKIKSGVHDRDIWKMEVDVPELWNGNASHFEDSSGVMDEGDRHTADAITRRNNANHDICLQAQRLVKMTSDYFGASFKLNAEIDRTLQSLKRSQESEYRAAEQKLHAHKDLLLGLYQQLDAKRAELAQIPDKLPSAAGSSSDRLLANVLNIVDHIEEEVVKLRQMMEIGDGFGRTPKGILEEHFGLQVKD